MLLKKLTVTNVRDEFLTLPLSDISNGFIVKEIEGLGPVKASLVSTNFANLDGEQYHTGRREARNIIIQLGLDPNYSVQSIHHLRAQLYNFFMPKTEVSLRFFLWDGVLQAEAEDELIVDIVGRIESFEPAIFAKEPTVTLSLLCYAPEFVEPTKITLNQDTVDTGGAYADVDYTGTVESGFLFKMTSDRNIDDFSLRFENAEIGTQILIFFSLGIIAGDILEISTVIGDKYVHRVRGITTDSILYKLTTGFERLMFFPGSNLIRADLVGASIPYTIEYYNRHGGL